MKPRTYFSFAILSAVLIILNACTVASVKTMQPTFDPTGTILVKTVAAATATSQAELSESQLGYPKIANLWGLYRTNYPADFYANFDLLIPYTFKEAEQVSAEIYILNPYALILHNQFGTKGREEMDALIHEWWVSKLGDRGYPCLLRDSSGNILITTGWKHPMVNLINEDCRRQIAEKNINEYLDSGKNTSGARIYSGIYWDLLFGKITWLGDDIDSNLDGVPDNEDELNEEYKRSVIDYLRQIRLALPQAVLMGNEAPIEYSTLINGRLFEWQIAALLDGLELNSWEEIITDYREWAISGEKPRTTIIENAPEQALIDKFGTSQVNEISAALAEEAATSYQRMRFGLVSALMGDGYYSFDLGKTAHGQFWWYDEYGRKLTDPPSSGLPDQGYLGQPLGELQKIDSISVTQEPHPLKEAWKDLITSPEEDIKSYDVWIREFEHGIAIANPTNTARSVQLDQEYCRLNGTQAPLFEVRVEDNQADSSGSWKEREANFNQFGETVLSILNVSGASVTYRPDIFYSGEYEVLVWVAPASDQAASVNYLVEYSGGKAEISIDQSNGEPGWRSLGKYPFEKGTNQTVKIYSSSEGQVIADAVKWVSTARFNDGSRVDSLVIQAHDGIVLIDCALNKEIQ